MNCRACRKKLTGDEVAIYQKLIGIGGDGALCKSCLAEGLHCTVPVIDEKIRQYREAGCFLFP